MAHQMTIVGALVALMAINSVSATFGMGGIGYPLAGGYDGALGAAVPAAAANIDSARATAHSIAADNRATEAQMDRATGNPIGAAINENRAIQHSVASNVAAGRSSVEAGLAGGLGGSAGAALGANVAANAASRSALNGVVGPAAGYGLGYNGLGYNGLGYNNLAYGPSVLPNAFPGAYGAGFVNPAYGPLGYGAGMRALATGANALNGAAIANQMAGAAAVGRL